MFSVIVLRRLRSCVSHLSVSTGLFPVGRHPAPVSVSCFSGVSGNQLTLHAVKRSFPIKNKVQSLPQFARCLSTTPPSDYGNLIYTGNMGAPVRGLKLFSYCTTGVNLIILPQIFLKAGFGVQSLAVQVAGVGAAVFFTFLTPILFYFLTKGYVLRLYHDPDRDIYTAITSSVFLTDKKTVFHQNQVQIPAISKMFTTFYAGQEGFLVNPNLFTSPNDYNRLMGYDKPFSFSIDDIDQPDRS